MIYVLIPSYNDSENFEPLLENINSTLKNQKFKVIIVDDGSTDNTKQIISQLSKKFPVLRIGYSKNCGPGAAFRFGFNFLIPKLKNSDFVVTMEADNTADFSILTNMLEKAYQFEVILASPYAVGGKFLGVSKFRIFLSQIANFADSVILRVGKVKTYSSFYRVFRADVLKKIRKVYGEKFLTEDSFPVFVEFLIKLGKIGAKITEIPATVNWRKRKGKSKMKIRKSVVNHFSLYYKFLTGQYNLPVE